MLWVFIFEKHMVRIENPLVKTPDYASDTNFDTYLACKVGN